MRILYLIPFASIPFFVYACGSDSDSAGTGSDASTTGSDGAVSDGQAIGDGSISDGGADAQVAGDPRGIYAVWRGMIGDTPPVVALSSDEQSTLTVAGINGVFVASAWMYIEPAPGNFVWGPLDARLQAAADAGKNIEIGLNAGASTPDWLFGDADAGDAGPPATPLNFSFSAHNGVNGNCRAFTMAAPWDPAFLARWSIVIHALAAHVKTMPYASAVRIVKLSGINTETEEMRLPIETLADVSGTNCIDNIAAWKMDGYEPMLVKSAFDALVADTLDAFPSSLFPGVDFSSTIIANGQQAFPPIDDTNKIITPASSAPDMNAPLLHAANLKVGAGTFVIQSDYLMTDAAANPLTVAYANNESSRIAFQTNALFGNDRGAACGGTPADASDCDAATYLNQLEEGVYPAGYMDGGRSTFLEVHTGESQFPTALSTALTDLTK